MSPTLPGSRARGSSSSSCRLRLGDVEPAADHAADVARLVQQRRSRPRDHDLLAARLTKVFSKWPLGWARLPRSARATSSRSSGAMKTSQNDCQRTSSTFVDSRSHASQAGSVGDPAIRVERHSRDGAVSTIVSRNPNWARSLACSRSLSSQSAAAAATASTSSGSSLSEGSWMSAAVGRPSCSTSVTQHGCRLHRRAACRRAARSARARAASRRSRASGRAASARSHRGAALPRPSSTSRSATPLRASRLRSTPARNATGTSANVTRKT